VAHAEASARSVDAAVSAAAAQLGLRSDQVDVEVLEEPVPSTFGYIGSPARVRVKPRPPAGSGGGFELAGTGVSAGSPEDVSAAGGSGSDVLGTGVASDGPGHMAAAAGSAVGGSAPVGSGSAPTGPDHPSTQDPSTEAKVSIESDYADASGSASGAPAVPGPVPSAAAETGNGQVPADEPRPADQSEQPAEEPAPSQATTESATSSPKASVASEAPTAPGTPTAPEAPAAPGATREPVGPGAPAAPVAFEASTAPAAASTSASASAASPSLVDAGAPPSPSTPSVPRVDAGADAATGSGSRATRPPRRTYKDEPIEPHMVEEDTERAGDFLEGLLDALDVDGDITTWVDEVGGHIDLEGTDLDALVGSNGETLDALQELTRLAVLRQSKRRVRLLIDINGFRARQREQLTSMVRTTVEQVIRTREDHEFQPMTPAERKVVHDAVAAIDGVVTESLGEEPNRRVVIRPT
jgi:spoIIIJ-associated protein